MSSQNNFEIKKSELEWQRDLSPRSFRVLRQAGTEPAFNNEFWDNHCPGQYSCKACNSLLFSAKCKYDSHSGWPSFFQAVDDTALIRKVDQKYGIVRTETLCAKCGSHIGHLFDDGPKPTGLRFCCNSAALAFTATSL